jgi:hypothetical protein
MEGASEYSDITFADGYMQKATYHWEPGFRLGFSFYRAPSTWEIKFQYTRMTLAGSDQTAAPSAVDVRGPYLTGTWPQVVAGSLASADSHLHMNYNVGDVFVTRVFIPNLHLRLRLLGGLTSAWLDQDFKINYFNTTADYTTVRNRWKFAGGGLKAGTVFDWFWSSDMYVTGMATFSSVIGHYANRAKQVTNLESTPSNPAVDVRNSKYFDTRPLFNAQFLIGPSWQKNFSSSRWEVFAGLEMTTWMNVNEIFRSTGGVVTEAKETLINSSFLTLYGLTARVTADF